MTFHEVGFTTGSDEYDTPAEIFAPIAEAVGGFDLDPCASETSDLADENIRLEGGLQTRWYGKVFLNPPYSEAGEWMKHAAHAAADGHTELIVGLVFARTDTQWFHNYATTADLWCFVEGRVSFVGTPGGAPAPSLIPVWGDYPDVLPTVLKRQGWVVERDDT